MIGHAAGASQRLEDVAPLSLLRLVLAMHIRCRAPNETGKEVAVATCGRDWTAENTPGEKNTAGGLKNVVRRVPVCDTRCPQQSQRWVRAAGQLCCLLLFYGVMARWLRCCCDYFSLWFALIIRTNKSTVLFSFCWERDSGFSGSSKGVSIVLAPSILETQIRS